MYRRFNLVLRWAWVLSWDLSLHRLSGKRAAGVSGEVERGEEVSNVFEQMDVNGALILQMDVERVIVTGMKADGAVMEPKI
jgi:hypothetical protein